MAKLSREDLEDALYEEEMIQEEVKDLEDVNAWEKQQDFNIVEEEYDSLPKEVTITHEWIE